MNEPIKFPQDQPYFQFPLCALVYGKTALERFDAIIAYGIMETGKVLMTRDNAKQGSFWIGQTSYSHVPAGFDWNNHTHLYILVGAKRIGMQTPNLNWVVGHHNALASFLTQFESRYMKDCLVRVKRDFVLDARAGRGISLWEFCVLAAIYSVIGRKRGRVRITHDTIVHALLAIGARKLPKRNGVIAQTVRIRLRNGSCVEF